MIRKDYYQILGVKPDAEGDEVRRSFRKKALELHPDRNKDPDASERMGEVNEAYAVLIDPVKRRNYDLMRQQFGSSAQDRFRDKYSHEDIFHGSDIHDVLNDLSRVFGIRGFEDLFNGKHGPVHRSFHYRRPGMSARGFVFSTSAGSGKRPVLWPPGVGIGGILADGIKKRLGFLAPRRGKDRHDRIVISRRLAGFGGKVQYHCRLNDKVLMITIPPGIESGSRLRLKGMGDPGKGGGEPGDLYVSIKIRPRFFQWLKETVAELSKK